MTQREEDKIELTCPCCGAKLSIDRELGRVLSHQPPPKHFKPPDFDHATQLLEKEKARRESLFNQSAEDEKVKSRVLERKFEEALKKTKDEPITRPTREIDLD